MNILLPKEFINQYGIKLFKKLEKACSEYAIDYLCTNINYPMVAGIKIYNMTDSEEDRCYVKFVCERVERGFIFFFIELGIYSVLENIDYIIDEYSKIKEAHNTYDNSILKNDFVNISTPINTN